MGADGGAGDAGPEKRTVRLRERTSVDTLVERLGLLQVGEGRLAEAGGCDRRAEGRVDGFGSVKRKGGREMLETKVERDLRVGAVAPAGPARKLRGKSRAEDKLVVSLFCCVRSVDPDDMPPPRPCPHPQSHGNRTHRANRPPMKEIPAARRGVANGPVNTEAAKPPSNGADSGRASQPASQRAPIHLPSPRPIPRQPPSSTQTLLSLIPKSLPPHTTSALLAELAKPLPPPSPDDAGYIYIFHLTDTASIPLPPAAVSLLLHTPPRPHSHSHPPPPPKPTRTAATPTLLLKIGRASNVQRRLNEWARQCGHAPELVRYYPHDPHYPHPPAVPPVPVTSSPFALPTTPTPTPTSMPRVPRKVPHASRVERLVHVELADRRAKRACAVCGRAHREWFEVEASAEGVRGVDEVVARWVKWGEGVGG